MEGCEVKLGFLRNIVWAGAVALCVGCATPSPVADLGTKAKKLGSQLAGWMTPKPRPKVDSTDDPVSLSGEPKQVPAALYTQAAWYAEQQGNVNAALAQYERALQADRRDLTTLISYARFLDRNGKSEEALRLYQTAQSVAPQNAIVWNDLGLFHARRRAWEPALQSLRRAVALQPENLRYRNNIAAVLIEAERPEDAVRELEGVHPPALARYNVACLLELHQLHEAASQYHAQAIQLDPTLAARHRPPEANPKPGSKGRVSAITVSTAAPSQAAAATAPSDRLRPPDGTQDGDSRTPNSQLVRPPTESARGPRTDEALRLPNPDATGSPQAE
jgi:tetratricopeptide (TPR) repeat protein